MKQTVAVGLSGGIDSFAAALLLKRQGYQVTGVHLRLWGDREEEGLEEVAQRLEIGIYRYDGREVFRQKVVQPFIEEYLNGRTPNPCAICNHSVKWDLLCRAADEIGAEKVATGHYVRIGNTGLHSYVCKGVDPVKDQSYFLWGLPEKILKRACTPLGSYTKKQVRQLASDYGYAKLLQRRESMGICFLEGEDYRDFVSRSADTPDIQKEGDIVDISGRVIGRHSGLLNYTIGQKQGMPFAEREALYVAAIRKEENVIVADRKACLFRNELRIKDLNIIDPTDLQARDIEVKVRGLGLNPQGYACITAQDEKHLHIRLSSPAWAPAPGQPVVLYRGDHLIGGGILQ